MDTNSLIGSESTRGPQTRPSVKRPKAPFSSGRIEIRLVLACRRGGPPSAIYSDRNSFLRLVVFKTERERNSCDMTTAGLLGRSWRSTELIQLFAKQIMCSP